MKKIFLILVLLACLGKVLPSQAVVEPSYHKEALAQLEATAGKQGANFALPADPRLAAALLIRALMGILTIIFLAYVVYAGYLLIASGGEEEKISKGKKIMLYAVLGTIMAFSSYGLTLWVDRQVRLATGESVPDSWLYFGAGFQIDQDTSQFYNSDPLEQSTNMGNIFGDGASSEWTP